MPLAELSWDGWYTLGVIVAMIGALLREAIRPDLILLSALGLLLVGNVIPTETALSGFSNTAMLTVGALYVIAGGLQRTGALRATDQIFISKSAKLPGLLARIMVPSAFMSAFLNNTPIVAMLIPRIERIAARLKVPPSKVLIPLSYATIAGGMTTLIGTSTNLVAHGILLDAGLSGFTLFQFAWIGLPVSIMVFVYMAFVGHRLLPDTGIPYEKSAADAAEYQFELKIAPRSPLIGQTVAGAQLRNLRDAFLIHIQRDGHAIGPISPDELLQAEDVLTFVGEPFMLDRLLERPGLKRPVSAPSSKRQPPRSLPLYEAVVADTSSLVGKTLRSSNFRERFQGVVVAIHRNKERISGALGNVPLKPGDLLLVEAQPGFDERLAGQKDEFYLVASRDREKKPRSAKAPLALGLLGGMIALNLLNILPLVSAAFVAALGMIFLGCIHPSEVGQTIDMSVLLIIASALGIGQAVEASGLANVVAYLIKWAGTGLGITGVVLALYLLTNLLTEFVTNNAAVALMLPIALATATDLAVDPTAFLVTVTIASSASFISPIGYQTNLMVMGAGGYAFKDYTRVGLPIAIGTMILTVVIVQIVWL